MKNTQHNQPNKQKGLHMKAKLVFMAALSAFVLLGMTSAFAAGTYAGTVIKNVASMTYSDSLGSSFATLYSDTTTTTVQQIAGVALTPTGSKQYASDSMYVYFPHTVTNTGNGIDTYNLLSDDDNTYNWSATVIRDENGNGVVDAADTNIVSATASLDTNQTYKFFVRLFVPNNTSSNELDTIRTTATSTFVDPGPNALPTASAWVRDSVSTQVPEITVDKTTVDLAPEPGQSIDYVIDYTNAGTGWGTGAVLVDTLDNNVTYAGNASVNVGSVSVTGQILTWTVGNIAGGATGQLTFSATVNSGVAENTPISNHAYLFFTDSLSGRTKKPLGGPITSTVSGTGSLDLKIAAIGASFTTNNDDDSVEVSLDVYYKIMLANLGNSTDSVLFSTRNSSLPLTWALYRDVNEDGQFNAGTDTYFDITADTLVVAQSDTAYFIAVDTVGQSLTDRAIDSTYYEVSSIRFSATDNGYHLTTIKAPVMSLTKSAVGLIGNRTRPGDTIQYTITYTNAGSAPGYQIVISDMLSGGLLTNVTYVPNSVTINNSANGNVWTSKTDAVNSNDDEVVASSSLITVTLGTVGPRLMNSPTYTGQIRFKVTIN